MDAERPRPFYRLTINSNWAWAATSPQGYDEWLKRVTKNDHGIRETLNTLGRLSMPHWEFEGGDNWINQFDGKELALGFHCTIVFPLLNPIKRKSVEDKVAYLEANYGYPDPKVVMLRSYAEPGVHAGVTITQLATPGREPEALPGWDPGLTVSPRRLKRTFTDHAASSAEETPAEGKTSGEKDPNPPKKKKAA